MAYEPTNWKTGDVVTSAKLNKLEQGVAEAGGGSGGGVFLVAFSEGSDESIVADKSLSEVTDALNEGLVGVGTYGTIVLFAVEVPVFKSITTVTPSGLFQRTLVWTQDGSINMVETAYPSESGQS